MIWLPVFVCLVVAFIFSGVEAGILSMNRVRLRHRVKLRDRAALVLDGLLEHPGRLLVTVLVVTNLMTVCALTLATQELVRLLGNQGYAVALLIALPVHLVFVELLPKSIFRRFPYRAVAFLSTPLRLTDLLLSPLHIVGDLTVKALLRGRPAEHRKLFGGREDFKYLTIESERTGALTRFEREMIHNVVDFRALTARQLMLPIAQVKSIACTASVEELIDRSRRDNLEIWPVCNAAGDLAGVVSVFDIALDGRRRGAVESYQRRIVKVSTDEPAHGVLQKLRVARATIAAVTGAHGEPVGIVVWADLIKRLVAAPALPAAEARPTSDGARSVGA